MHEGDILRIIGPNGAGKTTLFQWILGIQNGYSGKNLIFNQGVRKNKNALQKKSIDHGFPATVKVIISFGIRVTRRRKRIFSSKSEYLTNNRDYNNIYYLNTFDHKIDKSIETVGGLSKLKNKQIGELSGGEQQMVLVAKAPVNDPKLLISDELTTGVNKNTLPQKLNKEYKLSIIWSYSDLDVLNKIENKVACINRKMYFHGNTQEFFENNNDLFLSTFSPESNMITQMCSHISNKVVIIMMFVQLNLIQNG